MDAVPGGFDESAPQQPSGAAHEMRAARVLGSWGLGATVHDRNPTILLKFLGLYLRSCRVSIINSSDCWGAVKERNLNYQKERYVAKHMVSAL